MSCKKLLIGVYLDAAKKEMLNWKECEQLAASENFCFQDLDGQKEIPDQGAFSLIICKLTKYAVKLLLLLLILQEKLP